MTGDQPEWHRLQGIATEALRSYRDECDRKRMLGPDASPRLDEAHGAIRAALTAQDREWRDNP